MGIGWDGESTTENPVKDTGSPGFSWQGPELDFIIASFGYLVDTINEALEKIKANIKTLEDENIEIRPASRKK